MKCLRIAGNDDLANRFIQDFRSSLPGKSVCVVSESETGEFSVLFPGTETALEVIKAMPPDIVLVRSDIELAAPYVQCGTEVADDCSLLLARYDGNGFKTDFKDMYMKTFNLLPQKTADECGKCGMDCRQLAEAVLKGEKREEDCYFASSDVEVKLGGKLIELSRFPSGIIGGAVRGLVSSLKGYSSDDDISIKVKAEISSTE